MCRTTRFRQACLALGLCLCPFQLSAAEAEFNVGTFPDKGLKALRGASLVLQTVAEEDKTAQDLLAAARADYERLLAVLYGFGYYGGTISIRVNGQEAADISPLGGPETVETIAVNVTPGPRFAFADMRITPLAPATQLPETWRRGGRADSAVLAEATDAAIDGWRDIGHAKAAVAAQSVVADHRDNTISADIRLAPGPRLRFGALLQQGQSAVRPERVREIAGLPTGAVFSPEDLDKATERLRRSGAFRSVSLDEAAVVGPGDTLDILATLEDAKPRRIGFGAEIASLEGLTLSGFWLHRNLFGGAERLRLEGEVSGIAGDTGGIDYSFSTRFDRPATFSTDTGFYVAATLEQADEPDYRERTARIETGLTQIFSDTLTGELGIAYQYTETDDVLGSRSLDHILFPGRLTFDNRDDPLDASEGIYVGFEATPFAEIGDNVVGARLFLDARTYRGFGAERETVLALRAQIGTVLGADFDQVPSEMLFFSGGAGTVRGQSYQSLGVAVPGLGQVGGRSFAALSTELRHGLSGPWSVVGFADAGYVGEDSFGADGGAWHAGAGLGARYATGFGPIRVDIATPLGDDAGRNFELYIGIGQAF